MPADRSSENICIFLKDFPGLHDTTHEDMNASVKIARLCAFSGPGDSLGSVRKAPLVCSAPTFAEAFT
jgi:hypothetical protein